MELDKFMLKAIMKTNRQKKKWEKPKNKLRESDWPYQTFKCTKNPL